MESPITNAHNKQEYAPAHTCEHIINRTMINLFHCGRAVSAHIEQKKSKLDYAIPKSPSKEEIKLLEDTVNAIITKDLPVCTEYIMQKDAIGRFDLNRLPANASEYVRIVKVGTYDECLCIGQHVEHTAQIGRFSITSYSYENGTLRIRWKVTGI